jgi:16S rRNA (uracil1498-N3)-methyltransferase
MGHIPHLYIPGPWEKDLLSLDDEHRHHLRRVLRVADGSPVTYTDGGGTVGRGTVIGEGIQRGAEETVGRPKPSLTVAVAPPRDSARSRFIVEKLAELGVDRLVWLLTQYGQSGAPRVEKARQWAAGSLQQSRGAWVMEVESRAGLTECPGPVWIVHPGGGPIPAPTDSVTLAIGPEGGFSPEELTQGDAMVGLGARVLRVETAAIVATGLVLHHVGRMNT